MQEARIYKHFPHPHTKKAPHTEVPHLAGLQGFEP
jgi:hypothetical protein